MPKATASAARQSRRHNPLEEDLLATTQVKPKNSLKRKAKRTEDEEEKYVDAKASRKILKIGQELRDEEESEKKAGQPSVNTAFDFGSRFAEDEAKEEETGAFDDEEAWGDEDEIVEEVELAPDDLDAYRKFFPDDDGTDGLGEAFRRQGWGDSSLGEAPQGEGESTNLADLILQRIAEHEAKQAGNSGDGIPMGGAVPDDQYEIPEKVVAAFTTIGQFLSRYKSGKLPKLFKILPTTPHWEDILVITQPHNWTPNACYEATKIFVSSTPLVAQRFLEMVILDQVRSEIHETKKLNVHLFNALKKGLYKPSAWFKGILFPLVSSGTCTLREATIISAVMARVSIPNLHSAAALKGLCDIAAEEASAGTEGGGATNIFIKTLLEKKYALPYQVIDSLVFHFLRFRNENPASVGMDDVANGMEGVSTGKSKDFKLPVIWHQSLLAFAQRYRNDITEDQRELLLDLLNTKGHSQIGPEVRRELLEGRNRGVQLEPQTAVVDGDDTMMID